MSRERKPPPPRDNPPRSSGEFIALYERIRLATPENNTELLALSDSVKMHTGSFDIGYTRAPDYFAAARESGALPWILLLRDGGGRLSGTTSLVIRDAYLRGEHATYGYFCDLRTLPNMERATWLEFARYYYEGVRYAPSFADAGHPQLFLTAVIDSNERAMRLLRNRLPGLAYRALESYVIVQSFFRFRPAFDRPERVLRKRGIFIRRATDADAPALRGFLSAECRRAPLGEWSEGTGEDEILRRLRVWGDFSWSSFWVAENEHRIVACVAPRECVARKAVISGLSVGKRLLGQLLRLFAARPIKNNEPLDIVYLTHFIVSAELAADTEQRLRRALLLRAHRHDLRGRHALSWIEWSRFSKTRIAAGEFACMRTKGTLYQVLRQEDVGSALDFSTRPWAEPPILDVSIL